MSEWAINILTLIALAVICRIIGILLRRSDVGRTVLSFASKLMYLFVLGIIGRILEIGHLQWFTKSADWLFTQFKDWAIIFVGSFLHYELVDTKEAEDAELYRQAIAAFDGNVPSFHIELSGKPVMLWDFHSLMALIHLVLGLMITDDNQPLRSCKYCNRAFVAKHPKSEYCKPACKNKHNVYKSRGKE